MYYNVNLRSINFFLWRSFDYSSSDPPINRRHWPSLSSLFLHLTQFLSLCLIVTVFFSLSYSHCLLLIVTFSLSLSHCLFHWRSLSNNRQPKPLSLLLLGTQRKQRSKPWFPSHRLLGLSLTPPPLTLTVLLTRNLRTKIKIVRVRSQLGIDQHSSQQVRFIKFLKYQYFAYSSPVHAAISIRFAYIGKRSYFFGVQWIDGFSISSHFIWYHW